MNITSVINTRDERGSFLLSPLLRTDDYLEPYIGARSVRFHYYKHLKTYIDNVNSLKVDAESTIEGILSQSNGALYNNASQVYNHYLYFEQLNTEGVPFPLPNTLRLLKDSGFDFMSFKHKIIESGMNVFGSGWVFAVIDGSKVSIESYVGTFTPNKKILLALDVWEHAYYLDYQNDRKHYIENFLNALDWAVVEERYLSITCV